MRNKKFYSYTLFLTFLFFSCLFTTSCSPVKEGTISSSLTKIADITVFKTAEDTDYFCTAPCAFLTPTTTYLLRNFPAQLPQNASEINEFVENGNITKKIEVYNNYDYKNICSEILLDDIQPREIVFYEIAQYSDFFHIIGREKLDDSFITKAYTFSLNGSLIEEHELNINNPTSSFIHKNFCYSIEQNDTDTHSFSLIKYNMITTEIHVVEDNITNAFMSNEEIFYIKQNHQNDENTFREVYSYADDKSTFLFSFDPISPDITSAFYDSKNNILYYADYSRIYKHVPHEHTSTCSHHHSEDVLIFTVSESYVNILSCTEPVLLFEIGHNQLSVFQIGE